MKSNNTVAKILFVIGIIEMVAALILGSVFANAARYVTYEGSTGFSFTIFLTTLASGIITGMLTIGLSEIIKLLQSIKENSVKKGEEDDLELMK